MNSPAAQSLYPLRFEPIFRRYLWGGRRLGTRLHKPIGDGDDYSESWEIVDHGKDQTAVAYGPLRGIKLGELIVTHGEALCGRHAPQTMFPLLIKFLDCNRNLSVQVHPDDARAALLDPPDLGKNEAWIIMDAEPGAVVYAGLKQDVTEEQFSAACRAGDCEALLHSFAPRSGDCIFIPAGAVHALGEGLLVAEVQQASDTTYRLYDWKRLGTDGQPRQLHLDQGLEAVDFTQMEIAASEARPTDRPHVTRLVECADFVIDRWKFQGKQSIGGDDRFQTLVMLDGQIEVEHDPAGAPMLIGDTMLIPASCGETRLTATKDATFLVSYLP